MEEKDRDIIEAQGGVLDVSEVEIEMTRFWAWFAIAALCLWVFGWGMFIMMNVDDLKRSWDFGEYQDTPASSVLSSSSEGFRQLPPQIQLPGGDKSKQQEKKP
ncbi:MAG TPA: hypothetical protein VHO43_00030 [Ignavibacteriales bacterium]|jgi:hypothetical protein|nr:hypothetical protein [Ignavibacteriales bacterium]